MSKKNLRYHPWWQLSWQLAWLGSMDYNPVFILGDDKFVLYPFSFSGTPIVSETWIENWKLKDHCRKIITRRITAWEHRWKCRWSDTLFSITFIEIDSGLKSRPVNPLSWNGHLCSRTQTLHSAAADIGSAETLQTPRDTPAARLSTYWAAQLGSGMSNILSRAVIHHMNTGPSRALRLAVKWAVTWSTGSIMPSP